MVTVEGNLPLYVDSIWTLIFFALFLGTLAALLFVINAFTKKIAEVEKARAAIQIEETRVFDFLHGLGEAFSEGVRSSELHRLIVEGANRILESHGGVLYLLDRSDSVLVPAYVSKGCPALIPVPAHILEQAETLPIALESYIKLQSIRPEEGAIGRAWQLGEALVLNEPDLVTADKRHSSLTASSGLIAPLSYRRKTLGVLALANGPMSTPFDEEDLNLFRSIAEQSAFALYNEAVYSEANEKRKLDHDLEIAREIQSILLPSASPDLPGFEISGLNLPARQVSGDYYDYLLVDDTHLGVAIADVSGKGIPASLVMTMCRSVIRSHAAGQLSPAEALRNVNRQLYPDIREDMFISMAYLIFDPNTPEVLLSRAGHDAPLLFRAATGEVETLNPKGMALGIDSGSVFDRVTTDFQFTMESGDCLLLYTDGATEAMDSNGLEFGIPRLVQGLQAGAPLGVRNVIERLSADVKTFAGNNVQYDDVTLIAIRKL